MDTLTVTVIGGIVWCLFVFELMYLHMSPQAKIRRRLLTMIETAERERAKAARARKAEEKELELQKKVELTRTFRYRIIRPVIKKFVELLQQLTPVSIISMLEMYIFRAGKQGVWSMKRVAAMWSLSVVLGVGLMMFIMHYKKFLIAQKIILLILGGLAGASFPFFMLRIKIRNRQRTLKRQLPEFLDLLCVSVQAGLSFDGAVTKIISRMSNDLSEEFRHVMDDIKFGMTKQYALNQMAKRCDIEEIYLFTTSIIQAEKLGTSMAQTLQLQSDNMRDRHRQHVRAEAMKAPVKMLFPMVIFIFPSIFVVLLLPSLLALIKTLGKG